MGHLASLLSAGYVGITTYLCIRLQVQRLDGLYDRSRCTEASIGPDNRRMAYRIKSLRHVYQCHGQGMLTFLRSVNDIVKYHDILGASIHWLEGPLTRIDVAVLM